MALIKCPECGKQISDKADVCIGCGYPIKKINTVKYCKNCGCELIIDESKELGLCPLCNFKAQMERDQKEADERARAPQRFEDMKFKGDYGFWILS
jgi:predicted amidophosphoribosyltransferase